MANKPVVADLSVRIFAGKNVSVLMITGLHRLEGREKSQKAIGSLGDWFSMVFD